MYNIYFVAGELLTAASNIAKVQAKTVVFWPFDDIELADLTSPNRFARFWYCDDIHHSSICNCNKLLESKLQ
jgi:hypothetical protein